MQSKLTRLGHWLQRRAENVAVTLLCVMFATFIVQIFARYVLNKPVGWSEEVIITTWLWTVLWGAAFILRESEEIRFDIIYSAVSERTRRVFTVLTGIALVVLYGISLPAAYQYVSLMPRPRLHQHKVGRGSHHSGILCPRRTERRSPRNSHYAQQSARRQASAW